MYKEEAPTTSVARNQKGQKVNIPNLKYNTAVKTPVKAQGKIIGYLEGNCFRKRVIGSKHKLRKPPGWCISKQAFCEQILPNTQQIIVEDIEAGVTYHCSTELFVEHCFEIERGGYEPQLALGLKFWEIKGNGHRQLSFAFEGGDGNARCR